MRSFQRGQSILEYSILLVIIMAAFITMQIYIKRGFQGRWKSAVDELGDQFDPHKSNSDYYYNMISNSETHISIRRDVVNGVDGFYTLREDTFNTRETKNGILRLDN